MSDESASTDVGARRVFLSYSRADRQRVIGLADLLEGLGHEVFLDERSLFSGERWKKRLMDALLESHALVVFWTRHAARSRWVETEYRTFARERPERPILPVVGDATPLSAPLAECQSTDFCPLLNEVLALTRDLESRGISKSAIRKAVVKRLEEEGIELPPGKLKRIYGL